MLKKLKYNRRRPFLAIRRLQFGECCPKHGRGGAVGHVRILFSNFGEPCSTYDKSWKCVNFDFSLKYFWLFCLKPATNKFIKTQILPASLIFFF